MFQKADPTQDVTNPVSLPSFIVCTIFFFSLTPCNTSTFLTWSVQLIFSILLQHHISELSRYFCLPPYKATPKGSISLFSSPLKFLSPIAGEKSLLLLLLLLLLPLLLPLFLLPLLLILLPRLLPVLHFPLLLPLPRLLPFPLLLPRLIPFPLFLLPLLLLPPLLLFLLYLLFRLFLLFFFFFFFFFFFLTAALAIAVVNLIFPVYVLHHWLPIYPNS